MEDYLDNEKEGGPVIFYIDGPVEEQIGGNMQIKERPKKPRALVYSLFEWSVDDSRYECKICGYAVL